MSQKISVSSPLSILHSANFKKWNIRNDLASFLFSEDCVICSLPFSVDAAHYLEKLK